MREIESSNRLYEEGGALYLSSTIVTKLATDRPQNSQVTFILRDGKLITNRYTDPLPFRRFVNYAERVGQYGELIAKSRESLVSLGRALAFEQQSGAVTLSNDVRTRYRTLSVIGAIYGMNFEHIPWLHGESGFAVALGMMVASAVIPYVIFKRRGRL